MYSDVTIRMPISLKIGLHDPFFIYSIVDLLLQNMASTSVIRQTTVVQQSPSLDNNLGTYRSTNILSVPDKVLFYNNGFGQSKTHCLTLLGFP
jgi:hypothetical protein